MKAGPGPHECLRPSPGWFTLHPFAKPGAQKNGAKVCKLNYGKPRPAHTRGVLTGKKCQEKKKKEKKINVAWLSEEEEKLC